MIRGLRLGKFHVAWLSNVQDFSYIVLGLHILVLQYNLLMIPNFKLDNKTWQILMK